MWLGGVDVVDAFVYIDAKRGGVGGVTLVTPSGTVSKGGGYGER